MAGLTLKHIYKVYSGRKTSQKHPIKSIINKIKKKEEVKPAVEKRSGNFVAVKDFNMEIEDGEFIVFVGPSGCGKSTTIRMIAGLEDISAGELLIDGVLVNDVAPKERDIAMVFQSYALYPHMTAQQNIEFALKLRKLPVEKKDKDGNPVLSIDKKKIKELKEKIKTVQYDIEDAEDEESKNMLLARKEGLEKDLKYYSETPVQAYSYKHMSKEEISAKVQWAAKILGIEELLDNKPAEMSGGQRQRIALGRAMVRGPKVFLLDEPLSNLDAKLRASMRLEIVKLHKELKTTFIYVTHDQVEAMTMGTRIVVMKLGVVQQIDTPTNLYDFPDNKFVAGFIGTPQMNFMDVTIKKVEDKLQTTFDNGQTVSFNLKNMRGIDAAYLDGEAHEVTLGIRGEHINAGVKKVAGSIETTLSVKEVLGNITQLFIKLTPDGQDYIVSVPERNDYQSGDSIYVTFKEQSIHLFDKQTEKSIMNREYGEGNYLGK
ncbi:MAG: ATP-binding cassette domain-containing protein [Clostridia bacterium]|nr:ATP-binding cassette domain-containing protein [Clostridia bacterium]